MKLKIFVYLSMIFSFICLEFDYLVTLAMEKFYGEIFYTQLEGNILVQQTHDINVILIPLFILLLLYIIYQITLLIIHKPSKTICLILDSVFITQFILLGSMHLYGGLSWFLSGRF